MSSNFTETLYFNWGAAGDISVHLNRGSINFLAQNPLSGSK